MGDNTKQIDSAPPEIQNLRRMFTQYLQTPGPGPGVMGQTGATSSQPQNLFIGANQFQDPNAPNPGVTGGPVSGTNPVTGQTPGTGPTFGTPTTPPSPPSYPTSPTPTTSPSSPTIGSGSFLDSILTPKSKTAAGSSGSFGSFQLPQGYTPGPDMTVPGGGFGGYDPNRPPPEYAPQAWQLTPQQIQQPWLYGGARANPDGTTSYLTPEQYYQGARINGQLVSGAQAVGPQTGGPTPGSATGGFFSGNMNSISGTRPSPVVAGASAYEAPPMPPIIPTFPDGSTMPPEGFQPPPGWGGWTPPMTGPGGGGPVATGGPTGQGSGPIYPNAPVGAGTPGTVPGNSSFDRMISQLPPDMQRIVLGNPALINELRQATEQFTAPQSQSVDQLGGANSAFFQNMMQQLAPAFSQRRAEGLAAAKEASGNLTGSGYANALGSSINRSLGEEQATLAEYATRGLQTEVQRQLQQGGLDLSAMELGQRGQLANIATEMQRRGYNADQINRFILTQAGMDSQRIQTQYGAAVANNQFNAQQFLQGLMGLLGQKNDVAVEGGAGAAIGPIASALPWIIAAA